jgi:hypothetical protein
MNNELPESVEKIAALEYLKSGNQTEITKQIEKLASGLEGGFEEKINQIFDIVKILPYKTENKDGVFRKRTAGQIIIDGYVTGCTDEALVFIALARAAKIPAKYIETIDNEWLRTGGSSVGGHIYAGVFYDNKWRTANPSTKQIDIDIEGDDRTIYKEGLDSWDIGIDSFDSLRTQFNHFRETK